MSLNKIRMRLRSSISSEACRINLKCVIIGAVIILLCGVLSSLAGGSTESYRELVRPRLAPPPILFPIVWTVLYVLIGGAAGAVACSCDKSSEADKYKGLLFFVIMMVFNFIWSPLFFGAKAFFAALCAVIMMIALTVFTVWYFAKIYKIAAAAMVVYLVWLMYAAYLNLAVIILN